MENLIKCEDLYTNEVVNINLRMIINGQYEKTMSRDDLEVTRFIIGGMDAK